MRHAIILLAAIATGGCAAKQPVVAPQTPVDAPPSITVFYPAAGFHVESEEDGQADQGGFHDYRSVVRSAANKDRRALARFLYISANAPFDAAGAEQQQSTLCQMLLRWGDRDFADVLRTQPAAVRKQVLSRLARSSHRFAVIFPLTAAAQSP